MILAAKDENSLEEVLIIASALSVQDPRERPVEKQQAADEKHSAFRDEHSDFLAYLNLWREYHEQKRHLSHNKLRKWCQANFLSYVRMRDWHEIHSQLLGLVKEMGWRPNQQSADYAAIHKALLAGLLGNVANRSEAREQDYLGARGIKLHLFPGSALFRKKPKWIIAAELVETRRLYARTVARIEPEWIEQVAGPLLKRSYFEPHWEKKPAAVMAFERTTLYGLIVNARRKINYGRINAGEARQIFIRQALVAGEFRTQAPFFAHNQRLVAEIEEIEAKARRRDVLVDEEAIFAFYDKLIPADVYDGRRFERWRKKVEQQDARLLYLDRDYLMRHGAGAVSEAQFPEVLRTQGLELALSYTFEPGDADDGVTVSVPLPALNLLRPEPFDWLVPGLLHDKLVYLIKSLPKNLRRNFVPAPNFADACLAALTPAEVPLTEALAKQLLRMTGVAVPADAWDEARLPDHLRMNFKVVDEAGKVVARGRDLRQLQSRLGDRAKQSFAAVPVWQAERDEIERWDFGELPESVEFERNGVKMRGFPALMIEGDAIALRLSDSLASAEAASRQALRQLILRQLPDKVKYLDKNLPGIDKMCLYYAPIGQCGDLKHQLIAKVVDIAFLAQGLPRTQAEFEASLQRGRGQLVTVANELAARVLAILGEYHKIAKRLKGNLQPAWIHAMSDIQAQLGALMARDFVVDTPAEWLREYPRYLKAINRRLDKLRDGVTRDRQAMQEIAPLWQRYLARREQNGQAGTRDPELERYRWMIEELRVSLFAQELKTKMPVSVKRLEAQWQKVVG